VEAAGLLAERSQMQPSLATRRGRLMVRCLVIVSIVAVSAAIFASPVAATEPVKYPIAYTFSAELSDVCPFPVNLDGTVSGFGIDYFDKNGALIRTFYHNVEQDTFYANGKALVGLPFYANIEILFDSSGNITQVFGDGIFEKIPLPDGSLFISAGRAEFVHHGAFYLLSPDKGNPGNIAGFCAALAP
jgi:hypothetical protein